MALNSYGLDDPTLTDQFDPIDLTQPLDDPNGVIVKAPQQRQDAGAPTSSPQNDFGTQTNNGGNADSGGFWGFQGATPLTADQIAAQQRAAVPADTGTTTQRDSGATDPGAGTRGQTDPSNLNFDSGSFANGPDANLAMTIQSAMRLGYTGQNLVDYLQKEGVQGIQYYPGQGARGVYGLPGSYISFDNGQWNVTTRGPEGASGSSSSSNGQNSGTDISGLLAQLLAKQSSNPRDQALYDQIQAMIGSANQPVDPNDPIIKANTDAFRNEATRGARQGQAALAEQNAYRGITTGARDAGTAGLYENAGRSTADYQGQQLTNERTARRNQLQQALSISLGQNNADQTRELQAEIAAIDAQLRQQGVTNQNNQFYDSLGLSAAEQQALLNSQLLNQMIG